MDRGQQGVVKTVKLSHEPKPPILIKQLEFILSKFDFVLGYQENISYKLEKGFFS
jgi:hypothetical protein